MDFRQIHYFVCLYEEGSVTRAARRLNIVQPALSMQMAKLEEEVGQPLFVRSRQGMRPTNHARRMYRLFLPVLADFARARDEVTRAGTELVGRVSIGMIETIAQGVLVDAFLEFSTQHPRVELSLTHGFSGSLIDAVGVGQLDAAIINKPRRSVALESTPIVEEDMLLVCAPRHAPLPDALPFASLTDLRLVLPTRQHGLRGIIEDLARTEDLQLAPAVEIDSIGAIVKLVCESDFCTLLPRVAVRSPLAAGELRGHAVNAPVLRRQIVCVAHHRRPPGPAAAAFIATLVRHVKGLGQAS